MTVRLKYFVVMVCLFCLSICTTGIAQQNQDSKHFFVYIQNEKGTPFYVKEGSSLMSSSSAGYIIIPQLAEGKYTFTIGFPGHEVSEASFNVNLDGSGDKGFLIREQDKSFQLLGLRNYNMIKPLAVASAPGNRIVDLPTTSKQVNTSKKNEIAKADEHKKPETTIIKENPENKSVDDSDAFSRMLNEITGKSKSAPTDESATIKKTTPSDHPKLTVNKNPVNKSELPDKKVHVNVRQANGLSGDSDTISTEESASKKPGHSQGNELKFITFSTDSVRKNTDREQALQLDNKDVKIDSAKIASGDSIANKNIQTEKNNQVKTQQQLTIGNSDCQHLADEDDFQKVRRKIASRSSDEAMYNMAKKYFSGGTCYSTAQVKSLTFLFITDDYKFKFLELAYAHVYDTAKFPSLIKTLGSDYYQDRFKAMVR